jgi:hypothetical protein
VYAYLYLRILPDMAAWRNKMQGVLASVFLFTAACSLPLLAAPMPLQGHLRLPVQTLPLPQLPLLPALLMPLPQPPLPPAMPLWQQLRTVSLVLMFRVLLQTQPTLQLLGLRLRQHLRSQRPLPAP